MNILVIAGSARKNGNSERLADSFIEGAEESGNTVKKITMHNKKIGPCLDCKYCFRNDGKCIQRDDMEAVYIELAKADMVVIATPVYFYSFPAQLKCLFDRLYSPVRNSFCIKCAGLLTVCADSGLEVFEPMIAMYNAILKYFNIEDKGIITVDCVSDRGDIAGNNGLNDAVNFGRGLK
ncbi:MAG: flavodoxin family protein [Eubacteriales bacterium]